LLGTGEGSIRTMLAFAGIRLPMRGDQLVQALKEAAEKFSALVPESYLEQLAQVSDSLALAEKTFNGEHYSRAILTTDLSYMDAGTTETLGRIREIMASYYGDDWATVGTLTATDDIAASFQADVSRVSWITIGAVFLIILISFRNVLVPILLVCAIQGAIWVNMAFSGLVDHSIFFMCYLICMALQMGATVDYGILLTGHYRNLRKQLDKKAAIEKALDLSMQTILTSGLALVTAGFAVGIISSVFYISSIGTMLGRGAIVSVVMILFLVPQMLLWLDPWIVGKEGKTNA
ncbi:MAG: MMPL family transporter, partial [Clostridia bacterium]|nr:MMPL family transporter [Clostridia bacterium]